MNDVELSNSVVRLYQLGIDNELRRMAYASI